MNRGAANFRIHEVRKLTTPLASGEFSNGAFGEITGGGYNRLRLRGPNGARDEFLLAATAQNLRKLAKLVRNPG